MSRNFTLWSVFAGDRGTARFHAAAAFAWLGFGIFGLVQYLLYLQDHPDPRAFMPVAQSIPILFFISVYANVVGHWASYQAKHGEIKQDQKS